MQLVGNQATQKIGEEVCRTPVPGMLDLVAVFELVIDGLNKVPLPEHELVPGREQLVLHVSPDASDELCALLPERFEQISGDISPVSIQLAMELLTELCSQPWIVVGHVSWSEHERGEFTSFIDHHVQFEPVEPAHAAFATGCQSFEDFVPSNAVVVTDNHLGRVNEVGTCWRTKQVHNQSMERNGDSAHELYEPAVAHESREIRTKIDTDVVNVIPLERFVVTLVKVNENGEYFAQAQRTSFVPSSFARRNQVAPPARFKLLAELINAVE